MRITLFTSAAIVLAVASSAAAQVPGAGRNSETGLPGERQTFGTGGSSRILTVDPAERYRDGVTAFNAGKYREAQRAFRDVLRADSRDPITNFFMGISLANDAKIKESLSYFERAVRNKKDLTEARVWLGVAYVKAGDTEKANEQKTALTALKTECAGACADAGVIDAALKSIEDAIADPTVSFPLPPKAG